MKVAVVLLLLVSVVLLEARPLNDEEEALAERILQRVAEKRDMANVQVSKRYSTQYSEIEALNAIGYLVQDIKDNM